MPLAISQVENFKRGLAVTICFISGIVSRIAVFKECIFAPLIEPEQSTIQIKWSENGEESLSIA